MSSSIENMNHAELDAVRSTKELKETLKINAKMFVCEEHVTLWITPQKRKVCMK
jgi:hypothetical protein